MPRRRGRWLSRCGWTGPFVLLFVAVAVMAVACWVVALPGDVEGERA